jgi:RNA polymerase sigma-70 factor (ECF subfamily)
MRIPAWRGHSEVRTTPQPEAGNDQVRGLEDMTAALIGPNDADRLRALHDEHAHALWLYVLGLTGDRGKAQDIVQETLLRAWRSLPRLEQFGGSGRRWLFTVAKRIVIDEWRAVQRRPVVMTDQVPEQFMGDMAQQIVDRQLVRSALRTLSTDHRRVVLECYFRGASVAEAAETLGVPSGTVKSRNHYALQALRKAIDAAGGREPLSS